MPLPCRSLCRCGKAWRKPESYWEDCERFWELYNACYHFRRAGPDDLAAIFPMSLIEQEMSAVYQKCGRSSSNTLKPSVPPDAGTGRRGAAIGARRPVRRRSAGTTGPGSADRDPLARSPGLIAPIRRSRCGSPCGAATNGSSSRS